MARVLGEVKSVILNFGCTLGNTTWGAFLNICFVLASPDCRFNWPGVEPMHCSLSRTNSDIPSGLERALGPGSLTLESPEER